MKDIPESFNRFEILGRLNPKVVDVGEPGGGGNKTDVLCTSDIAAAMTGIPRGPTLLALTKYAGDTSVINELVDIVTARIQVKAKRKKLEPIYPGQFRQMAVLALQEAEVTPQICRRCRGRHEGMILVRKPKRHWIICPSCRGNGKFERSEKSKARSVGIPIKDWRSTWGGLQGGIRAMLIQWQWLCVKKLIKQLRYRDE